MELTKHDWMLAWVSLVHASTYMISELDRHLRDEVGISLPEHDLLSQLDKVGGEVMLSELARRVYLSKAGMTKMVDRLERAGQVERVRPGPDRRVTSAKLTTAGRATLDRSRPTLMTWVDANLRDHLSDAQVISLQDSLRALLEGHGRWEGQMRHLLGEPHEDFDRLGVEDVGGG
ncbi:MAG: winged helix-turn-helix transcriptional regulator [Gemmatimonadetes bacterium]|nr:winged helix-turn-helix transcriptional regulator [Gemmatimonadota bacterium]